MDAIVVQFAVYENADFGVKKMMGLSDFCRFDVSIISRSTAVVAKTFSEWKKSFVFPARSFGETAET